MSGKYSDSRFFFAHYGCCIPTESYAWILVVLFITTILVLLFCMLATATIRWMYKRRMRKRLQDLKHKFQLDQLKAQEFEAKLNFMAQKNKSANTLASYDSKDGKSDKLTIYVDPAQNYAQNNSKNKAMVYDPKKSRNTAVQAPAIYDQDETPIAQSTLATPSTIQGPKENRWFMPQQKAPLRRPITKDQISAPIPIPSAPIIYPPPPPTEPPPPIETGIIPTNTDGFGSSPEKNTSPLKRNSKELAPPPITSTSGISEFTTGSTPMTTTESTTPTSGIPTGEIYLATSMTTPTFGSTVTSSGTSGGSTGAIGTTGTTGPPATAESKDTAPATGTTNPSESTTAPSGISQNSAPSLPVKDGLVVVSSDEKQNTSPGDDVKANLQYGQDDIVSPRVSDKAEERKEGGGGRSEWKYYYANMDGKRRSSSSILTKSSTSNRPSSNSWLFDSTGSHRFEAAKEGTSRSSSIIKTDSSQYRTSVESFPHGAFAFQQ